MNFRQMIQKFINKCSPRPVYIFCFLFRKVAMPWCSCSWSGNSYSVY